MKPVKALLLFLMMACGQAFSAPSFSFETTEQIRPGDLDALLPAFHAASALVRELPPSRGNPLRSSVERRVHFVLTLSDDPVARNFGKTDTYGADAFSLTDTQVDSDADLVTYVFLLVDRICRDETGRQRPDAYVRMIAAIGHEIYGNLPGHLKAVPHQIFENTYAAKQKDEIAAHRAGVSFLNRLIKSNLSEGIDGEQLSDALSREKASLERWKNGTACGGKIAGEAGAPVFVFSRGRVFQWRPKK